jgi:hypothetical protein
MDQLTNQLRESVLEALKTETGRIRYGWSKAIADRSGFNDRYVRKVLAGEWDNEKILLTAADYIAERNEEKRKAIEAAQNRLAKASLA